jgi:transposase
MAAAFPGPRCSNPTPLPLTAAPPHPACSAPPIPDGPCPVCPRLAQEFEPWRQASYWKALHQRACQREELLQRRVAELEAQLRLREQQLFGRKTEACAATARATTPTAPGTPPRRGRGQQPGYPGPRRRDYSHLPAVIEERELPDGACCCRRCGRPFAPVSGTEDSTILEVEVRAHRRVIRRHRYRPTCDCGAHPGLVTAPPAPRVIPKSLLGVSLLVELLAAKYLSYRPTYRLLADLATRDLNLSLGTVTDALQRLLPLFEPVYEALAARSRGQPLWHGDETRWLVFATVEGKVGFRWYLWVFHSAEVVVFVLAQGRAHDVPEQYLGPQAEGILVVDRYKAYQAIAQVKAGLIVLAFCWARMSGATS